MLNIDFNNIEASLWTLLILSIGFFAVFLLCYKKRIVSIFDPLVILVIMQTAYSVMALAVITSPLLLIQFFASQAAFSVGFLLVPAPRLRVDETNWDHRETLTAECTIFLLFLVVLFANAWLGIVAGFPIFSDDPSLSKVSSYTGGLGLVRRINSGIGILVPAGALVLAVRGKHRALFGAIFAICIFLASLSGSKGALFVYLNIIGYLLYRKDLVSTHTARRLRRASILLAGAASSLAIIVLYVALQNWQYAIAGVMQRIVLEGDGIIYYYSYKVLPHFAAYGPLDFFYMLLNPLLGGLRIVPYQAPLGYEMVQYYLGNSSLSGIVIGPNTPYFLVGHIYFGSFFGVLYCGAVGFTVGLVRSWFLNARRVSPLWLIWLLTLALLVHNLPGEVNTFTSPVLDTLILLAFATGLTYIFLFILRTATKVPANAAHTPTTTLPRTLPRS